jgi:hypothetical protein
MPIEELNDWSDVREWLKGGNIPVSAPIVRRLLAERDTLAQACHDMQIELDLCRLKIRALTCAECGGTGRKAIGEHQTLQTEWVTDYADCDHGATNAD